MDSSQRVDTSCGKAIPWACAVAMLVERRAEAYLMIPHSACMIAISKAQALPLQLGITSVGPRAIIDDGSPNNAEAEDILSLSASPPSRSTMMVLYSFMKRHAKRFLFPDYIQDGF